MVASAVTAVRTSNLTCILCCQWIKKGGGHVPIWGCGPSDIVTIFRVGFTLRVCSVFSQPCLLFVKKCCVLLIYYPQSLADWTWQHCS